MKKLWNCLDHRLKRRLIILFLFVGFVILFLIIGFIVKKNETSVKAANYDSYDCYENMIAITFDDGPRRGTTDKLLDGLKERNVKATFFLIGKYIEGNEDIVQRMYDEGHLIGNHTFSHIQVLTVSTQEAYNEIQKTNEIIASITGETPIYFRPPYGAYSESLLKKINMTPVMWSIDPDDWNTTNVDAIVRAVVKKAKCGDIILMHDFYDTSVTAALEIIDQLQAKGFVFVTVDQLLLD